MAEVAGIVLGTIPLIISALEHYDDMIEPLVAFVHWKGQLSGLTRRLRNCQVFYDMNIRLLLKQSVNDQDINNMIEDPRSNLWRDSALVDDLQFKLGTAYQQCMDIIQQIESVMINIATFLNIDGLAQQGLGAIIVANPPVPQTTSSNRRTFHFKQRVVFLMKRRQMKARLEELEDCNNTLYRFLEGAERIQANAQSVATSSRPCVQFVAPLRKIQQNAARLYRALTQVTPTLPRPNANPPINPVFPSLSMELRNICSVINGAAHPYVGFRLDSCGTLRGPFGIESRSRQLLSNCLPLQVVLPEIRANRIPSADLYCLVITLASSVLQLSETPWLYRPWDKQAVIFLRLRDHHQSLVDIRHPYLTFQCDTVHKWTKP
ncbi:hypothetical protein NM208_g1556 [Fusarium decemcellulare]|uniref:Uncharacterized protein n=2 Tax=Fusarium decemcellulare TaxID=57161 RepID=A0ACC1SVZ0_9HYPO|nr:hypothetical protein NM208_g4969 [Fusarium decemcellulare]KAJ3547360.1 hypothetical protein NM208_g1556 [Fusarium decemcellulare]